jgi:hypothetical protein
LGDLILGDLVPSDRWNYQFLEIHDPATNLDGPNDPPKTVLQMEDPSRK